MAKDQPNLFDLLPSLESPDLHEVEQVKGQLQDLLSADKGSVLLNGLVDYYIDNSSIQAVDILSSIREPHDKHLFDKMNECMTRQGSRLPTLTLLGHVVRKQPSWIHKIVRFPLLSSLLKCLKTDSDVVVLITGVLVLITLLPMIPQTGKQLLFEVFDIFGRLAAWSQRNPGQVQGVYKIHLHASVYSLFHRLYGMYPCNFISYLRSHYSMKENVDTFEEVVKPMLEHVRVHPELVTGTKDYEMDPIRWKRFETHDIVIECAKVSLDPKEASCEEGYSSVPDHVPYPHGHHTSSSVDLSNYGSSSGSSISTVRQSLSLSLPHFTVTQPHHSPLTSNHQELQSSGVKDVLWSPSAVCGMSTPPSSRAMSPTSGSEPSQSASLLSGRAHIMPVDGKSTPCGSTPSGSSPLPSLSEELERSDAAQDKPVQVKQEPIKELRNGSATNKKDGSDDGTKQMTLNELSDFVTRTEREREEDAITEELLKLTESKYSTWPTPNQDSLFSSTMETQHGMQNEPDHLPLTQNPNLLSTPDKPDNTSQTLSQPSPWSLWPSFTPIESSSLSGSPHAPDEATPHFNRCGSYLSNASRDSSLPYDPLFDLALPRAAALFVERKTTQALQRAVAGSERSGEAEPHDVSARSPLTVLDRMVQQGCDAHDLVLKRSPLQSPSSDSPSGGSVDLGMLRGQLLLLHNQLLYERYKREQHAIRNRRLLRRVINATALEEQNSSMKAQMKLQEVEMRTLRVSLQEEQQSYISFKEDREAQVSLLQTQLQHLQRERDDYYAKTQELQSDLQESQKQVGEMGAELQRVNNKMCNTGHLLSQLSLKLNNSESMEQQIAFLNKQLLLLGEANKLSVLEVQRLSPEATNELRMLQNTSLKEMERLRQSSIQQNQRLDTAQQRITDLEAQLAKKDQLIRDQKKLLENVKDQAKGQLHASDNRYLAQKHVTQALQAELLQLYSQLEISNLTSRTPAGEADEPCSPTHIRPNGSGTSSSPPQVSSQLQVGDPAHLCVNGSVFPDSAPTTTILNGGLEEEPLSGACSPTSPPSGSPLAAGSYPSAGSLLGIRARQLRNKSEREPEVEEDLPPLESLSLGLQAEQGHGGVVENLEPARRASAETQAPTSPPQAEGYRARAYNVQSRRQELKIMDYNETSQAKRE